LILHQRERFDHTLSEKFAASGQFLTLPKSWGIGNDIFRLFENHKIDIFFNDRWLSGVVVKDAYGWRLKDDSDNIIGLCPGIRARQLF
jgi:hypothetical protein